MLARRSGYVTSSARQVTRTLLCLLLHIPLQRVDAPLDIHSSRQSRTMGTSGERMPKVIVFDLESVRGAGKKPLCGRAADPPPLRTISYTLWDLWIDVSQDLHKDR